MSKEQKLVQQIVELREMIRSCDEAMVDTMDKLAEVAGLGKPIAHDGRTFMLVDIFEDGSATWRPARVMRYRLAESK